MKHNSVLNSFPKGLRRTLLLLSGAMVTFTSCGQQKISLSGTFDDIKGETLYVFSTYMDNSRQWLTDSVVMQDNHFEITLPDTALKVYITPKSMMPKGATRHTQGQPIFYFPGDQLTLKGTYKDHQVSGSALYADLQKHPEIDEMQAEITALNSAYTKAYKAKDDREKMRIKEEVKAKYAQMVDTKFNIIKADPSADIAAYFATQLSPEKGLEALSLLPESVKKGYFSFMIDKAKVSYENRLEKEKSKSSIQAGMKAPDFKFTTYDGKKVTLDSFKGKYLLLDFWGTWCGWCVKGMPAMKEAYAKYKNNIEFLGVCCKDTEKAWREGVAKLKLPWVNVLEGDTKTSVHYGLQSFPTKVLIDPEGKLVQVFIGETPELYKKLDELFKK